MTVASYPSAGGLALPLPARLAMSFTALIAMLGLINALVAEVPAFPPRTDNVFRIAAVGLTLVAVLCVVVAVMLLSRAQISVIVGLFIALPTLTASFFHGRPLELESQLSVSSGALLLILCLWGYLRLTSTTHQPPGSKTRSA